MTLVLSISLFCFKREKKKKCFVFVVRFQINKNIFFNWSVLQFREFAIKKFETWFFFQWILLVNTSVFDMCVWKTYRCHTFSISTIPNILIWQVEKFTCLLNLFDTVHSKALELYEYFQKIQNNMIENVYIKFTSTNQSNCSSFYIFFLSCLFVSFL